MYTLQVNNDNLLKYLDLLNGKIQKSQSISHSNNGFWSMTSHARSETAV